MSQPTANSPVRLAVLISGGGTTLLNFVEQIRTGDLNAEIALVISSQSSCLGIDRAKAAGLETHAVPRGQFKSAAEFSQDIFGRIRAANADLVTLAGFLSLIEIPDDYQHRVMNIHPSLIPAFCGHGFFGHKVHEAAVDRGVKISGCTVHFADNQYDHGPIILQRPVVVPSATTPDDLARLVFEQEKLAYPEAIRLFAAGRLRVSGRHVTVLDAIQGDHDA